MRAARFAFAALALAAAQPALAGVVYVPAAHVEQDGVARRTELVLSNPDDAATRAASVRFIAAGADGTALPQVQFPTLWTAAGASGARRVPAEALPAGATGMLEVFPGYGGLAVGARLVYERAGVYSQRVDFPAIDSSSVVPEGTTVYLQGLERAGSVITDLGLYNLGTDAAVCSVQVDGADGRDLFEADYALAGVSSVFLADVLGKGGLRAPAGSWARVDCDQPFWALAVRHDTANGATRAVLPVRSLGDSDLTAGEGAGSTDRQPAAFGSAANFQLPGEFLVCAPENKFWRTSLVDERNAGRQYRRIVVDFDVFHANWNPPKNTHIYMWLQNGPSWSRSLFGYLIASRRKGVMRFQVKYGNKQQVNAGRSGQPGGLYHVHYEWDGAARKVSFELTTPDGAVKAKKQLNLNKRRFTANGMFLGLGSWPTGHGPEALQYGWIYSNLNVDYFE